MAAAREQDRLGARLTVDVHARAERPVAGLRARIRFIILIACTCAAAWIAAMVYVGVWRLDLMMDRRVEATTQEAVLIANVGAHAVGRRLDALRAIPALLAGQERLSRALVKFDLMARTTPRRFWPNLLQRDDMLLLSRELEQTASSLNLEGIYLVTDGGYVVASSDALQKADHLGASFSGRDYFMQTMIDGQGERFGVDPVTGAPMFFFGHRIQIGSFHEGAVIVATSSARMLLPIERGSETVYLSDRNGIVVVSSETDLLFTTVDPGLMRGMSEDALLLRYGRIGFADTPTESHTGLHEGTVPDDGTSVHADASLERERITLHVLAPIPALAAARRDNLNATIGLGLLGVMLTLVVTLALVQIAQIKERATRDPLTGLANRRHADEVLPELLAMDDRGRLAGIAVVSFDLDHFKRVNDTWGHALGDRVLRRFAQIMLRSARRSDLVFRYGGEEFIAVLVEHDIDAVRTFAERVRAATEAIDDLEPIPPNKITVSAGATMRREGEAIHQIIARADELLYAAKDSGRNRVISDPA